jgi:AraC-like DNA-binding protein
VIVLLALVIMEYFDALTFLSASVDHGLGMTFDQSWPELYSIQYVTRGRILFGRDRRGSAPIEAPCVYWIEPRHTYQLAPVNNSELRHYVVFRGPRGRRLIRQGFNQLNPQGWMPVRNPETIDRIFRAFLQPVEHLTGRKHAEAVLLLDELLAALMESHARNPSQSPHRDAIETLARELQENPSPQCNLQEQARRMHMSYSHFRRLFRRHTGQAPHDFAVRARIQQAARELRVRGRQIKEAAANAGYDDAAEFSRTFRRVMGLSPKKYRATLM